MTIVLPTSDNINFQNYPGLLASIESRMDRTDLTADIPDWIYLAERELERRLLSPFREATATIAIDGPTSLLPVDFKALRSLTLLTDPPRPLQQVAPAVGAGNLGYFSGAPLGFMIMGDGISFTPTPDGTYTASIVYERSIPALTEASPSNWVLDRHPDVYFFGALMQGFAHIADEDRAAAYRGLFDTVIDQINEEGRRYRYRSSPVRVRSPVVV